jgi:hypothetical protein
METTYAGIPIYLACEFSRLFKTRYQGPGNEKGRAGMYFGYGKYKVKFYTYSEMHKLIREKKKEIQSNE